MLETRSYIDSTKNVLFDQLFDSLSSIEDTLDVEQCIAYQADPVGFGENILGEQYTPDVKALMKSVRDFEVTVAISANSTGKTHGAARVGVWWYKCFPGAQVYTAAAPPEANLRKLLWGEIGSITEINPNLFAEDVITSLHITKSAREFLTGVTVPSSGTEQQREAKFSGKHAPYLLFIIDEADAVPDEVFRGIESCMTGGMCRLLCMFNPRAVGGAVHRMIRDGRASVVELTAFNHPNVREGKDLFPGAVTREVTVKRINQWCRPLVKGEEPDAECFELPKFLEGATALDQTGNRFAPLKAGFYKIMESAFSYMVLGQYPAQGSSQLISRDWVAKARARWDAYVAENGEVPPKFVSGVMGQDVAEFGPDSNVSCFRYGGFVERLIDWTGVDTTVTGDRATEAYRARNIGRCNVDGTGVGTGVAPQMQKNNCSAVSVKHASKPTKKSDKGEFKILRDQLLWDVRLWLEHDPSAMLPPDELLEEELLCVTYEVKNGFVRVMPNDVIKEKLKRSGDRITGLFLTFYSDGVFDECDLT